jgi:hypothetical protein
VESSSATRGEASRQEVGRQRPAQRWPTAPVAEEAERGAEGCQRKKKGGRGPRDSCAKPEKSRDLLVK